MPNDHGRRTTPQLLSLMRAPITVIILTYNEAVNIVDCLHSVSWADDVVVVDSGSTDDTVAQARAVRPDVRVVTHPFQDFGDQRNWALDNTQPKHDWILFVDADEFCTPELAAEIEEFIRNPGEAVGAYVSGRNIFMGRWVRHASLYPSYQLRLLKRGHGRFRKEGHGQREAVDGPCVYLRKSWDHEWMSKGIGEWMERHRRYAEEESEAFMRVRSEPLGPLDALSGDAVVRRRLVKRLACRLGRFDPYVAWMYRYVVRGGWLDGRPGWILCSLLFAHRREIQKKCRAQLHRQCGGGPGETSMT